MRILIRSQGQPWRTPDVDTFKDEAALQVLLAESPGLLPGVGDEGVVAVRELYVPGTGPVDIVCVDHLGTITVCECKLSTNSDMRRTIVGQALAYASGLWRMSYDDFNHRFESRTNGDLASTVASTLEGTDIDWEEDGFRAAVAQNLRQGSFRLIFAVDEITEELRRIVEYLNDHTAPGVTILAIELGFVADSGVEILTPTVYGQEAANKKETRRRSASGGGPTTTSVGLIVQHGALAPGEILQLHPDQLRAEAREAVQAWGAVDPTVRLTATWQPDTPTKPFVWSMDKKPYTANGITQAIVEAAGAPWGSLQAPKAWYADDGRSLTVIADALRLASPSDDAADTAPSPDQPVE